MPIRNKQIGTHWISIVVVLICMTNMTKTTPISQDILVRKHFILIANMGSFPPMSGVYFSKMAALVYQSVVGHFIDNTFENVFSSQLVLMIKIRIGNFIWMNLKVPFCIRLSEVCRCVFVCAIMRLYFVILVKCTTNFFMI